jgi:hypothetical protein
MMCIFAAGCANKTANPVPVAQVGDESKSCDAIANEMQNMLNAQTTAEGDKNNQTGANIALGVVGAFLIVPWFFMDLGNAATVEQKAARARYERLQQMQTDKRCPASPISTSTQDVPGNKDSIAVSTSPARAAITPSSNAAKNDIPNPAKKLEDLNSMLKKGLITQDEYNAKKTEILRNL